MLQTGVNFLPLHIGSLIAAILAGVLPSVLGKYKALHAVSFALGAIGYGLVTTIDDSAAR